MKRPNCRAAGTSRCSRDHPARLGAMLRCPIRPLMRERKPTLVAPCHYGPTLPRRMAAKLIPAAAGESPNALLAPLADDEGLPAAAGPPPKDASDVGGATGTIGRAAERPRRDGLSGVPPRPDASAVRTDARPARGLAGGALNSSPFPTPHGLQNLRIAAIFWC